MELRELIGLHTLRRVEVLDDIHDQRIARFTLDDFRYEVFEYHLPNGLSKMVGPNVVGVASPGDGSGTGVFCLHRNTSFAGDSCDDADILEMYDVITANKILTIGTKNITRNCRCVIDGGPVRTRSVPAFPSVGTVECVELAVDNAPEFARKYLGRWQYGIDLAEGRDFTPPEE